MKHFRVFFCLYILIIWSYGIVSGGTGTSGTGYWASVSTWTINGINRAPNCGDTLTIPAGQTVTVNSQQDYSACAQPMFIIVYGTFQFTNGNKLTLPCGSLVYIMPGGIVKKATAGGGNSTYIDICGTIEWKAGDGPIGGFQILGDGSLPVSLLYFNAYKEENHVDLKWSTASEINNSYFNVNRSDDGITFNEMCRVQGAGNSTVERVYGCTDSHPKKGITYYQLCQTDYDGTKECFPTIAVKFDSKSTLEIVAASVKDQTLGLIFKDDAKEDCVVQITDLNGRLIYTNNISAVDGINQKELSIGAFRNGIYFISLTNVSSLSCKKFVVINN